MNQARIVPQELQEKVRRELASGEKIQWMEQPIPRCFTSVSTPAFLFAIPWTAFAIFWICGACGFKCPDFSKGGFSFFPLFGVPFVLIGFGMLCSPLWTYRKALKTVYIITDRRAIIFAAGWTTTIQSYLPNQLKSIVRKDKKDGTGDIVLAQCFPSSYRGGQQTQDIGFLNIREPRAVEQMLMDLAGRAPTT
jgi:hypothetical protein